MARHKDPPRQRRRHEEMVLCSWNSGVIIVFSHGSKHLRDGRRLIPMEEGVLCGIYLSFLRLDYHVDSQ